MRIVQTHRSPEEPALSRPLSPNPGRRITFQDWLGYTFGLIRAWHTYRKYPGPVSSLYPWLILKEVLNISAPPPFTVLLDTQSLRVTQQQATFFNSRLPGCQHCLLLPLRLLRLPCEPLTPLRLILCRWRLRLRFNISFLLCFSLHQPALLADRSLFNQLAGWVGVME